MAHILQFADKHGGYGQTGGWHPENMARQRYQKGSIRKRGTRYPIWELQWWEDYINAEGMIARRRQSRIIGSVAEHTRRQALKLAEEFLRPLNLGNVTPYSCITFREFVEQFFVLNALPTLKIITQKRYIRTLNNHLLPAFGEMKLREINTLSLQRFVLQKMDTGLGWASCDHFRNLMSKVFATAKKWGHFEGDNPAHGVELPEQTPVREKHILTHEQISSLLSVTEEPYRTMFLVGILTGLRVGEILGLRWRDIDFQRNNLKVEQSVYRGGIGTPKTKGSKRTLPLPPSVITALEHLHGQSGAETDEELIFHTRTGSPYSDTTLLHRQLKPAGQKIGAPWLSWHTFRRTHCTLFQESGGSLRDAQAQLGHTKMSTTLQIYTIPIDQRRRETVEKLDHLVTNGDELGKSKEDLQLLTLQIQ